jgi:hypothetical protein
MMKLKNTERLLAAVRNVVLAGGVIAILGTSVDSKASQSSGTPDANPHGLRERLEKVRSIVPNETGPLSSRVPAQELQYFGNWPNYGFSQFANIPWGKWGDWQQHFGNFFNQ